MPRFFVGSEFPSFKPIRTDAAKILSIIDASIAKATETKDLSYLNSLKVYATNAAENQQFYFTVAEAKLVGLI